MVVDAAHRLVAQVAGTPHGFIGELEAFGISPRADGAQDYEHADAVAAMCQTQAAALPALWRGWLVVESDVHGHGWYLTTALGREIAAEPEPPPPADMPAEDQAAGELYTTEQVAARRRFREMRPDDPNWLGRSPLPLGHPPLVETVTDA